MPEGSRLWVNPASTEGYRLWVNPASTVLVRLWASGKCEIAFRTDVAAIWGPPTMLEEEKHG